MIIQTQRLVLRPFTIHDVNEYYSLISNSKSIEKFVPFALTSSLEEMSKTIEKCYSKCNFKDDFYFILEEKSTKKIIGAIIAVRLIKEELDVSYLVGNEYRHKGYMFEAMKGFKDELKAINDLKIKYLSLMIDSTNSISQGLARKLGAYCVEIDCCKKTYLHFILEI